MPAAVGRTAELLLPKSSIKLAKVAGDRLIPIDPNQDHSLDLIKEACSQLGTATCKVLWNIV
jgi:hypothetical protein